MTTTTNWNETPPVNSNGTAHNGSNDTLTGWQCFNQCPACDEDAGNVCPSCGETATWGHQHDCPERWENSPDFVPAYTLP